MFDPGFPAKSLTMVRCLSSVARVYASGHDRTQEGLTKKDTVQTGAKHQIALVLFGLLPMKDTLFLPEI